MRAASKTKVSALAAVLVGLPIFGIVVLAATQSSWLPWLESGSFGAGAALVASIAVLCGFACLTAQAATVVAGYAFGWPVGTSLALLGVVLAGLVGYGFFARLIGSRWRVLLQRRPRLQAIHESLRTADARATTSVVALLRLAPIVPFSGTNLLMASVRARRVSFVLGTLLGFAPIALVMAIAGSTIADLRLREQPAASLWITLAFLVVSMLGLSLIARRSLAAAR